MVPSLTHSSKDRASLFKALVVFFWHKDMVLLERGSRRKTEACKLRMLLHKVVRVNFHLTRDSLVECTHVQGGTMCLDIRR